MRLAILGAGAWGSALAAVWGQAHAVTLWARDPEQARGLSARRVNERYLPDVKLPDSVAVTSEIHDALSQAQLVILAAPTIGMRAVLRQFRGVTPPLLWLCKGFEPDSVKLPCAKSPLSATSTV